jgi:ketosteroid isomerase-like protein
MSEQPTTGDPVETVRRAFEAFNRRDYDAAIAMWSPNAVWRGTVDDAEGAAAIRDLWVSYRSAFAELQVIVDDVVDFGDGVVLADTRHVGRLVGGGNLAERRAFVHEFVDGRIVRARDYTDIDRARADAERLAEERG